MGSPPIQDFFALDRDVARAARALAKYRAKLAADPPSAAGDDPLFAYRHVASRTTWRALAELSPAQVDRPLHGGLLRWIEALIDARVGLPDEVALAEARLAPAGLFEGEPPARVSFARAFRELAATPSPVEARLWLAAAADAAPAVAAASRLRVSKRVEVAARMGRAHPWEAMVPFAPAALHASATAFLDATEDIARAVWKEAFADRDSDGAAARIVAAGGRAAGEGWPARLTTAFFLDAFGDGARRLPLAPQRWPAPFSAASFARALAEFGFAARVASTPSSLPFVLGRDPAFVSAYRLGFTFASLAADPGFYTHSLGTSRRTALGQARVLARTFLTDARLHAARLSLGDEKAFAPRDRFDELTARILGAPLDPRLCGAFPAARSDEPARWVGLLRARSLRNALREQFDEDWFRNPRAWSHLEGLGTRVADEPESAAAPAPPENANELDEAAGALGRAFEEALG